MLLEVEGLCVNYGHIEAIRDITFGVEEGSVATLIGANGAGKSTTLKTISGLRKIRAGSIKFDGKDIKDPKDLSRVVADTAVGKEVDVVGALFLEVNDASVIAHVTGPKGQTIDVPLQWTGERNGEYRGTFTPGENGSYETRVEASRSGATLGTNVGHVRVAPSDSEYFDAAMRAPLLRRIRDDTGASLVIVEHDIPLVRSVADRLLAMDRGAVIANGTPDAVLSHPEVITSYLGVDAIASTAPSCGSSAGGTIWWAPSAGSPCTTRR